MNEWNAQCRCSDGHQVQVQMRIQLALFACHVTRLWRLARAARNAQTGAAKRRAAQRTSVDQTRQSSVRLNLGRNRRNATDKGQADDRCRAIGFDGALLLQSERDRACNCLGRLNGTSLNLLRGSSARKEPIETSHANQLGPKSRLLARFHHVNAATLAFELQNLQVWSSTIFI